MAKHINGANVDTNVPPVASHIRKKTATPSTQRKYRNIGVNPHKRQTSQEDEIGQKTSRGERIIGVRVEREIDLEIEVNPPGKRLGEL